MPNSTVWSPRHSALQSLLNALSAATAPVYVVGGVVRDHLLGLRKSTNDMDVVVEHSALLVARQVADMLGWAFYPMDPERDVARLVFTATTPPLVCDIAAMRGGTIERDLRARDFTVNALAVQWQGRKAVQLVDVTGGQSDLEHGILRRVSPSSLAEDPVRLLRAVRFAVQLGLAVEEQTELQMLRMADTIRLASTERVRDELWKTLQSEQPAAAVKMLRRYGLLPYVLPEVAGMVGVEQSAPHVLDVYQHTLAAVTFAKQLRDWLSGEEIPASTAAAHGWQAALAPWRFRLRDHFMQAITADHLRIDWLIWHALLHDIGKPQTRTVEEVPEADAAAAETGIEVRSQRYRFFGHDELGAEMTRGRLEALRFSRQEAQLGEEVVAAHMRPHHLHASFGANPLSRRACFRFFRDAGGRGFDVLPGIDVVILALADYQATTMADPPPDWEGYLRHMVQLLEFAFHTEGLQQVRRPLVDGHTLMRYFNLQPGPEVGSLLERLQEAQAAGEIASPDEALALAATWVLEKNN
ncbi:MAG: HDIG domain-containing protein [Caldilineaceae bacterium]